MTAQRPDRPVTRAEEIALAEASDLPPRLDGRDRLEPVGAEDRARPLGLEGARRRGDR
jgi:hypothetical protein